MTREACEPSDDRIESPEAMGGPRTPRSDVPMTAQRTIEIGTTRAQLEDLAPFWDSLDTYLSAPVGQYPWVLSCAEALAEDSRLFIPVVRIGGEAVATAPLVRPRGLFAVAGQLGVEEHGEPGDFNYRDVESLDLLAAELADKRVPLALARTPAESPLSAALLRAYRHRGLVVLRPQPGIPFIEIEGSEDDASAKLPARLRSDLRRARRRAERLGPISLRTHAPASEEELRPLWDEALRIEAAGWKARSRSALALDRRVESFYRSYAIRACQQGTLRIFFLALGEDTASTMIALEAGERLWILKIGYDERFSKCSPGMLLMHEALRYAAHEGLRSYEFLGSAADWTRRWTDRERPIQRVLVYPYTLQGMAVLISDTVRHLWRRARLRLKGG